MQTIFEANMYKQLGNTPDQHVKLLPLCSQQDVTRRTEQEKYYREQFRNFIKGGKLIVKWKIPKKQQRIIFIIYIYSL